MNTVVKPIHEDCRNIYDSISDKRPRGFVEIHEKLPDGQIKLIERPNLIVYQGRKFLMQRAFNQNLTGENDKDSFISWFGLGTGGTGPNLLIPIVPTLNDTSLNIPATINNKAGTNCILNGRLHPLDTISFLPDTGNSNEELIASILVTIGSDDANGPAGGTTASDYYDLNEASLYISDSTTQSDFISAPDAAQHVSTLKLFARVTFSTIRKFHERQIVFNWSVFF